MASPDWINDIRATLRDDEIQYIRANSQKLVPGEFVKYGGGEKGDSTAILASVVIAAIVLGGAATVAVLIFRKSRKRGGAW